MTMSTTQDRYPLILPSMLDFTLPPELEASEPPEARGLARDAVRLMVSYRSDDSVRHTHFHSLPDFLEAGDVLVINTSGTLNAALNAHSNDGTAYELHISTRLPADVWSVEVRRPVGDTHEPFYSATPGMVFHLPNGGRATLLTAYNPLERQQSGHTRLWLATLDLPDDIQAYLNEYGFPIRYRYVKQQWPNSYYQTVYATEPGSAEMPSAGRAFTHQLITQLVAKGVQVLPLVLHTGVASLESHEPPYEEYYRVPSETAAALNRARAAGRRIIAVGTTVVRALETVTDTQGVTHAGEGWTRLVITPQRGLRAVNGLLTGLHEPQATHLAMLRALVSADHLQRTYCEALCERYLWHEFGDLHLMLP
ncbi:MAG: S-adenosylmethionine:tRNA ribosyltransferase-isomerase [Anaerolineae bacterium]